LTYQALLSFCIWYRNRHATRDWNFLEFPGAACSLGRVDESVEALERRIGQLRTAVREAALAGEKARARALRAQLRDAERAWDDALADAEAGAGDENGPGSENDPGAGTVPATSLLPLREQVYEALSLLQAPAAPRLIATVHEAFFGTTFRTQRVTSLRRDEERSFGTAPFARPYYICAALSADYLAPSRGLLAVSTWPLELRVIGSLSPRVDFLTEAIRVAEAIERIPEPPAAARRLLQRFAASVSGAISPGGGADPAAVSEAARAELTVHRDADARARAAAAERARGLHHAEQLFGTTMFRDRAGDAADDAADAAGLEAKAAGE
jgi:hypothetical protein